RPAADLPTPLARRVAVVDRRAKAQALVARERASLVLSERLGRVEVESAQLRLAGEGIEDREVERERLPGRGAGRDDDVLAAPRGVPGFALVGVELVDAERVPDPRVEVVRQGYGPRPPSRLRREVGELLPFENGVPWSCGRCGLGLSHP